MKKLSLLAGAAIGAMVMAGIVQAQAPAPAQTTRNAVFVVTEQVISRLLLNAPRFSLGFGRGIVWR